MKRRPRRRSDVRLALRACAAPLRRSGPQPSYSSVHYQTLRRVDRLTGFGCRAAGGSRA
jgi:hypothetical protein